MKTLGQRKRRRGRLTALLIVSSFAVAACGDDGNGGKDGGINGEQHSDTLINGHVQALAYDPASLLNTRNISENLDREIIGEPVESEEQQGTSLLVCERTTFNLEENFNEVTILQPTAGIIWPGALVKANQGLLDGMPEPLTLAPAPVTLRVDLPGIGDHGTFVVEQPSNSAVQTKLDAALAWWNDHAYQEGYTNPSRSSFRASTAYTSEQLGLDVGLNVKWASVDLAPHLGYSSSSTETVAMMVYKQVFYTVTVDTPASPAAVFAESVMPSACSASMTPAAPPAYVHSVSYGRILMFRMETSEAATAGDMDLAMNFLRGMELPVEAQARVKSLVATSSIEMITLGGNAQVASQAVDTQTVEELPEVIADIIQGSATYSKSNPGVPIAYTVRFLKDNTVAKMGYTTDYTKIDCRLWKESRFTVKNVLTSGTAIVRAKARYMPRSSTVVVDSGWKGIAPMIGRVLFVIPAAAERVVLRAELLFIWGPELVDELIFDAPNIPESATYCVAIVVTYRELVACSDQLPTSLICPCD